MQDETFEEAPQPNCSKNCYVCSIRGGRLIAASEFPTPASSCLEPNEIGSETSESADGENDADQEFAPSGKRPGRHQEEDGGDRKAKLSREYGNPKKRVSNTNKVMHVSA